MFRGKKGCRAANLARRDADLALRHRMPKAGNLYASKAGVLAGAVYRRRGSDWSINGGNWICYPEEHAHYDTARWVERQVKTAGGRVALRASSLAVRYDAARAGVGMAILPCYAADADRELERIAQPINELAADYWVSVHRDLRQTPRVRAAIGWIRELFNRERDALAGIR